MRVLDREIVVSQDCLEVVADRLGLSLPPTLAAEPMWRSDEERHGRMDQVRAELVEAGLWRSGSPDSRFAETIGLLCGSGQEFFAHVGTAERDYRLHVAVSGRDAVLACYVPQSGRILFRAARAEAPVEDLVAELPECRPGVGPALTVAEVDLRAAMAGRPAQRDVRRLLDLFALPRYGGGQLSAGLRDGFGAHQTSGGDCCTFLDTENGAWLCSFTGSGAERYVNVAPARYDVVVAKMYELRDRLRGGRPERFLDMF